MHVILFLLCATALTRKAVLSYKTYKENKHKYIKDAFSDIHSELLSCKYNKIDIVYNKTVMLQDYIIKQNTINYITVSDKRNYLSLTNDIIEECLFIKSGKYKHFDDDIIIEIYYKII